MKFVRFLLASVAFVVLTCLVYWIHIAYFRVNVVFYSAMFDGAIAAVLMGLVLLLFRPMRIFNGFERLLMLCVWVLTAYALSISVPTVLDRSLSFYILEKLQQRGGGIREDRFADVFTQEYVKEERLVDVRLTEQLQSGTIRIVNGCVILTPKGDRLAAFSRFFRLHLLPKQRLLMGEYTDDLTDPFRHSPASMDYTCKE